MGTARGHLGNSARSITIALGISLAGFLYGLDTGIIASTIAQKTFKSYMYGPSLENVAITGGIVSGYYAGSAVGSAAAAYTMDACSRRWSLLIGSTVSVIGAVLQATAVNPAMMIVGRALSGFSTGMVYPVAPVYLSELSPPENRGFLVGLKGVLNTLGFFTAGWIGYAGSFAHGNLQWRIPLATQAPPAALLAVLTFFLPYSPRWLMQKERYDEAKQVMYHLHAHRGAAFIESEYAEMHAQIQLEADRQKNVKYTAIFTRQYIRRTLLGCLIVNMTKLSGSNIIQNYQSLMYEALGYEGQTVLLITAVYGFMAVIAQVISIFTIIDHWSRRTTILSGYTCLTTCLVILTALSKFYPDGHNPSGSRAGVAFIFLFAFAYSFFFNSIVWVLVSEIFPLELRGVGVGFSVFSQAITAIWLSYAASYAFDAITWRFYFVFIGTNVFAGLVYFFFLPETNQLSLEEVAAKFGDVIAEPTAKTLEVKGEHDAVEKAEAVEKTEARSAHIEQA
ncbi:general substrate transporter [Xylariaceae sp. FL0016]|nr:general substrate transporter [Xylariaceae sp. FL0016]